MNKTETAEKTRTKDTARRHTEKACFAAANSEPIVAEIRDEYCDVTSVTICYSMLEVLRFFREHGVEFKEVRHYFTPNKVELYTFSPHKTEATIAG